MSHRFGPRTRLTGAGADARVAQWMQRSLIKSIQRGSIALTSVATNTASISAVVTANTVLSWLSVEGGGASENAKHFVRIALTNSTTVTATRGGASADTATVSFEVIEYWPGVIKSIQNKTGTFAGVTPLNVTITAVNTAKTQLIWLGFQEDTASALITAEMRIALTSATNVQADSQTPSGTNQIFGFQVVEWY